MKKIKLITEKENYAIETAIENYITSCGVRGLAARTIQNYERTLDSFYA